MRWLRAMYSAVLCCHSRVVHVCPLGFHHSAAVARTPEKWIQTGPISVIRCEISGTVLSCASVSFQEGPLKVVRVSFSASLYLTANTPLASDSLQNDARGRKAEPATKKQPTETATLGASRLANCTCLCCQSYNHVADGLKV